MMVGMDAASEEDRLRLTELPLFDALVRLIPVRERLRDRPGMLAATGRS